MTVLLRDAPRCRLHLVTADWIKRGHLNQDELVKLVLPKNLELELRISQSDLVFEWSSCKHRRPELATFCQALDGGTRKKKKKTQLQRDKKWTSGNFAIQAPNSLVPPQHTTHGHMQISNILFQKRLPHLWHNHLHLLSFLLLNDSFGVFYSSFLY